jgi:hypothetical protein
LQFKINSFKSRFSILFFYFIKSEHEAMKEDDQD